MKASSARAARQNGLGALRNIEQAGARGWRLPVCIGQLDDSIEWRHEIVNRSDQAVEKRG
jgi:hypothetical protein